MADEWASLKEELSRKASESAHDLLYRYLEGDLTKAEAKAALNAVYDCVSGLVDWGIADLLRKAIKEIEG